VLFPLFDLLPPEVLDLAPFSYLLAAEVFVDLVEPALLGLLVVLLWGAAFAAALVPQGLEVGVPVDLQESDLLAADWVVVV
jgi:hypothetical protein